LKEPRRIGSASSRAAAGKRLALTGQAAAPDGEESRRGVSPEDQRDAGLVLDGCEQGAVEQHVAGHRLGDGGVRAALLLRARQDERVAVLRGLEDETRPAVS